MKLLLVLLSSFLVTSSCWAQPVRPDEPDKTGKTKQAAQANLVAVTFVSDDTCNLTIDKTDYKELIKNKTVPLALGTYKLFFESLETGKIIRDRSFRLTKDKLMGGKYTYTVTFKQ